MRSIKIAWFKIPRSARKTIGMILLLGFGMTIGYITGTFFIKLLFSLIIIAERLMDAFFKMIIF